MLASPIKLLTTLFHPIFVILIRNKRLFINSAYAVSSILVVCCFYFLYDFLHRFDWGHPFTKLLCLVAAVAMILFLRRGENSGKKIPDKTIKFEIIASAILLAWLVATLAPTYLARLKDGPWVDIGYTTQNSAIMLFKEKKNPYQSEEINVRPELAPEHRGFHYGPGMLLGYAASAYFPNIGYKITSYVYFIGTLVLLVMLIYRESDRENQSGLLASCLIAASLFLLSERFWYETFQQGANDIYPVFLIMLTLYFIARGWMLLAGVAIGLSFCTKFSPGVFLMFLLFRKDMSWRLVFGVLLGFTPFIPFIIWDYKAMIENVFVIRFTLNYDSTSLYSITPKELHSIFSYVQLGAVLIFVLKNFNEPIELKRLILHFTILLVIIEVTFKEIHGNHQIWFVPLFAYLAATYRHNLFFAFYSLTPKSETLRLTAPQS